MVLVIQSVLCGSSAEIEDTEHFFLRCIFFYSIERFKLFNNINKIELSFTQFDFIEQVNILLYGYPADKFNVLDGDTIKFAINFLKKSDRFVKQLISFNQWFYVLLFFFLSICLLFVITFC